MKIIDWVAFIGAMAWLPHLISLVKSYFTKPEVRIITQNFAEIGFTTLGPIFNMRVAFSVKNSDIVIFNFKIHVEHESGEKMVFEWQGLTQHLLQMHTNEGSIPYEKENSVLAIKLNPKDVEERTIKCQEISFLSGIKNLTDNAVKKAAFDLEEERFDSVEFGRCQEMLEYYTYVKQSCSWKAGKYSVIFQIEAPDDFNLVDNEYEFNLTRISIESLEKNKKNIEQDILNRLVPKEHEKYKEIKWNWANPNLYKKTD